MAAETRLAASRHSAYSQRSPRVFSVNSVVKDFFSANYNRGVCFERCVPRVSCLAVDLCVSSAAEELALAGSAQELVFIDYDLPA